MKTKSIPMIVGLSVALLTLVGVPAYGRGGGHRAGGHADLSGGSQVGFSGSARAGGAGHGYSGAGISHPAGSYGARHYSPGISTGRYGKYDREFLGAANNSCHELRFSSISMKPITHGSRRSTSKGRSASAARGSETFTSIEDDPLACERFLASARNDTAARDDLSLVPVSG